MGLWGWGWGVGVRVGVAVGGEVWVRARAGALA